MFNDLKGVCCRLMVARSFAIREAWYAEVIFMTDIFCAAYADL